MQQQARSCLQYPLLTHHKTIKDFVQNIEDKKQKRTTFSWDTNKMI